MSWYRCLFLTAERKIGGWRDIEAPDDAEAIVKARAYHAGEGIWFGFELWRGQHRVYVNLQADLGDGI